MAFGIKWLAFLDLYPCASGGFALTGETQLCLRGFSCSPCPGATCLRAAQSRDHWLEGSDEIVS